MIVKPLDHIAMPTHLLLSVIAPVDGNVFTVTVDGLLYTFEFDDTGSVTSGRIAIGIGGSGAETAMNAAAVMGTVIGDRVVLAADGICVDMRARLPDTALSGAVVSGAVTLVTVIDAQRSLPTVMLAFYRVIIPADVVRGKIIILVPLDVVAFVFVRVQTSATDVSTVNWTGVYTASAGRVELTNAGATPYAAGNALQLIVTGDRYE